MRRRVNFRFHFVMAATSMCVPACVRAAVLAALAACRYLAMVLTNWGTPVNDSDKQADLGEASMWVKMASQWTCLLAYTW